MVAVTFRPLFLPTILIVALVTTGCENSIQEVDSQFKKKIAVEEAFQVVSYLSQAGKLKGKLISPYMKRYLVDSPYVEFPNTLHVDFFNDSTQVESTVDALYARQTEFERKVLLRDSVVVINKLKGDTLRTSELWWDQNKQEFTTDKPVRIYQKTGQTFGQYGLRAKQDFSEWQIFNASGTRQVPPGGIPDSL